MRKNGRGRRDLDEKDVCHVFGHACRYYSLSGSVLCRVFSGEEKETNFVGLTRQDLIKQYLSVPDTKDPKGNLSIMIGVNSGYYYFENAEKLMAYEIVMKADRWRIKEGFRKEKNLLGVKWYFYELTFKDDVVVQQRIGCMSDGL